MRDRRALRDHDVVQHDASATALFVAQTSARAASCALSIWRGRRAAPSSDGIELGQRDLRQEAEAAEVHAEDRDVDAGPGDAAGHADQRAVAAQHDDQVARLSGSIFRRRRGSRSAGHAAQAPPVSVSKTGRMPRASSHAAMLGEHAGGAPSRRALGHEADATSHHVPATVQMEEELAVALYRR